MTSAVAGLREGRAPAAVLFDMDGLLVDTERLWTRAQEDLAAHLGGVFTPEIKAALMGRGPDTALHLMLSLLGVDGSRFAEAARFVMGRIVELFAAPGAIVARPGAVELLGALAVHRVPLALVSSSARVLMDHVLGAVGAARFQVSVAGDEVVRGKPDPEPYLRASRLLAVPPARCVVLEDSASGATAGLAAGCVTVLVPSTPQPPDVPADAVVPSLAHVTPAWLAALVDRRAPREG
ncbi:MULTISPECIES: HAD family phosphatase [Frankia]|uniref:HAD family hydrolase n=2 Tax=Frankiaceae TaxID=74712 RepID=UPI0005D114EC|nr:MULTISPECIES: HAD family phosphatase [Frankia]KQC37145.1 phosphatase [Frankia sp. ACN1ag]